MLAKMTGSIAIGVALAIPATVPAAHGSRAHHIAIGRCTMAVPPSGSTVEVEIANAADFGELVSQALAGEVFRSPVTVTPGILWHYSSAVLSCRLRYTGTGFRMTVRNSVATCGWFGRLAPDWHPVSSEATPASVAAPGVPLRRG